MNSWCTSWAQLFFRRWSEVQSKQRRAMTYENHFFSARLCNACYKHSHTKQCWCSVHLVSVFPVWRLIISCCLGLILLPEHSFKPQTMMSSAEFNRSATGNSRDWFRTLCRVSRRRSTYRSRLPISPSLKTDWTLTYVSRDCLCNTHYTHSGYSSGFICRSTPFFTLYFVHALFALAYGYSFMYGVARHSTYWWRAKPSMCS